MVFVEVVVVVVVSIEAAEVLVVVVVVVLVLVVVLVVGRGGRGGVQRKGVGVVVFGVVVDIVFPIEPGFVASRWALRGRGQNGRIPVESAIAHAATAAQGATGRVVGRKTVHPVVVDARNSNMSRVKNKAKSRGSHIFCFFSPRVPGSQRICYYAHTFSLKAADGALGPGALRDMGRLAGCWKHAGVTSPAIPVTHGSSSFRADTTGGERRYVPEKLGASLCPVNEDCRDNGHYDGLLRPGDQGSKGERERESHSETLS